MVDGNIKPDAILNQLSPNENEAPGNETAADWRRLLDECLIESDKNALHEKTNALEEALFVRLQQLSSDESAETEKAAMKEATWKLLRIRAEKLGFPVDRKFLDGGSSGTVKPEE
jgi:hypothetical protein